jgi:hypothetical protein
MSCQQLTSAHVATPRAGPLDPNTPQKKRSTMSVAMLRVVNPTQHIARDSATDFCDTAVPMQNTTKQTWLT